MKPRKAIVREIHAYVLAGGASSRMGREKALLEIGGVTMVERTARSVESLAGKAAIVGPPEKFHALAAKLGTRAIADDWPGAGPLGGIATALRASEAEWNLIVACDLPYLTREWMSFLVERATGTPGVKTDDEIERSTPKLKPSPSDSVEEADAVMAMSERGAEPLCAMYHKRCEAAIWLALDRGTRKVTEGLHGLRVEYIEPREWKRFDSEGLLFKNINRPEDYEEAKRGIEGRKER
jgi:molybdopterin-guanine dinucleotide biosynthesis protein A